MLRILGMVWVLGYCPLAGHAQYGVAGISAGMQVSGLNYLDGVGVGAFLEGRFATNGRLQASATAGLVTGREPANGGFARERINSLDLVLLYRLNTFDAPAGVYLGAGLGLLHTEVRGRSPFGTTFGSAVPFLAQVEIDYSPIPVFALYGALVARVITFGIDSPTDPFLTSSGSSTAKMRSQVVLRVGARYWW